jgi:hypothetical protein
VTAADITATVIVVVAPGVVVVEVAIVIACCEDWTVKTVFC